MIGKLNKDIHDNKTGYFRKGIKARVQLPVTLEAFMSYNYYFVWSFHIVGLIIGLLCPLILEHQNFQTIHPGLNLI